MPRLPADGPGHGPRHADHPGPTEPEPAGDQDGRAARRGPVVERTANSRDEPAGPPDRVAQIQREWARERPDLDVTPQGVIGRLHRLAGFLTEELVEVYRRHGLGEGDFDVLATLRRAGAPYERAPGELADHTMVTSGAMTKRVDRLVAAGLVTRRRSEADGRGRVVALTARGRELIDRAMDEHMANEHRLLEVLSPEQRAQLEALLTHWLRAHGG